MDVPPTVSVTSMLPRVDGSKHSARALEEAVDLARSEAGRLTVISVGTPPPIWPSPFQVVVTDAELERAARAVVDDAATTVPDDVPGATIAAVGRPADEIVTRAKEDNHDLIVMGARGGAERCLSCSAASAMPCSTRVPPGF